MKTRSWWIAPVLVALRAAVSLEAAAGTWTETIIEKFEDAGLSAVSIAYDSKSKTTWVIVRGTSGDCGALYKYSGGQIKLYKTFTNTGAAGCNPVSIDTLNNGILADDYVVVALDNHTIVELDTTAHTEQVITEPGALGASAQPASNSKSTSSTNAVKTAVYLYITTTGTDSGAIYRSTIKSNGAISKPALIFTFPSGSIPSVPAVVGSDGALYGVTENGGTENPKRCQPANFINGCGLVYRVRPGGTAWTEDVLYTFQGGSDGSEPNSRVAFDNKGNVYGTTLLGGDLTGSAKNCQGPELGLVYGCGEVYMLRNGNALPWKETTLHAFRDGDDGAEPFGPVILDKMGNVYGTTIAGGNLTQPNCLSSALSGQAAGCGVVFELAKGTWSETELYAFKGKSDGSQPTGGLAFDKEGNLFGTTWAGGDVSSSCFAGNGFGWGVGCGVFYELSPSKKDVYPTFIKWSH
jgi:hypothetical protein